MYSPRTFDQINTSKYPPVRTALKAAGKDWSKVMNEDGDVVLDWGFGGRP